MVDDSYPPHPSRGQPGPLSHLLWIRNHVKIRIHQGGARGRLHLFSTSRRLDCRTTVLRHIHSALSSCHHPIVRSAIVACGSDESYAGVRFRGTV